MYQAGGMKQPKRPLRWAMAGFLLLTAFCAGFVKSIALQQGIVLGAIPFVIGGLVPAAVLWGIGLGIGRLIRLLPKGSPAAARPPRDPKKPLQLARPPRWVLAGFVGAIVGLVAGFFGEDGGVFVEWWVPRSNCSTVISLIGRLRFRL